MSIVKTGIPGPSPADLARGMLQQEKDFDPAHIRPSGVGMCLKAQVLNILSVLYPEEYVPDKPDGKDSLIGAAVLGDMHEERRVWGWRRAYGGEIITQYDLRHPELKNVDGTPVTAHPDIFVPELNLDEEVKSTGAGSVNYLPKESHVDQLLLRLLWWRKYENRVMYGRITYSFRESLVNPDHPVVFEFVPEGDGYCLGDKCFDLSYMESLEERLFYVRRCLDTREIPPRHPKAVDQYYYECYFYSPELGHLECPWRESCWAEELAYERRPAIQVENIGGLLEEFVALKEQQQQADKVSRELKNRCRAIQKRLDSIFDEFGDRIAARGIVLERTLVEVPPRQAEGYSFYRYNVLR